MKYDLKDWMKPLGSLGRFKSSLVWKKRGSLVFSSVSASLMALPRGWSVLKIKHSGTDSILRCSELEKRRKSHKKRMDGAGSDVKNSPPALPGRAVSSQLSSHWGEMIIQRKQLTSVPLFPGRKMKIRESLFSLSRRGGVVLFVFLFSPFFVCLDKSQDTKAGLGWCQVQAQENKTEPSRPRGSVGAQGQSGNHIMESLVWDFGKG